MGGQLFVMSIQFSLIPFSPLASPESLKIEGEVCRQAGELNLVFAVRGDISRLLLPKVSPFASRRDGLWQSTCFECFIRDPNGQEYWEMNLSPKGDWNIYHFTDYRENMREEDRVSCLQASSTKTDSSYLLYCRLGAIPIVSTNRPLQLGISCILDSYTGDKSYWALHHGATKPDFHLASSFALAI